MAEVTPDLTCEILKQIPDRLGGVDRKPDEIKSELQALRIHSLAVQQDVQNICSVLTRHDARLDRIERRLEIVEVG